MSRVERLLEHISRLSPAEQVELAGRLLSRLEAGGLWPPSPPSEGEADAVLLFDGGSRGNPGPAYGSFLLVLPDGRRVHRRHEFGLLTGNQAEYHALLAGLKEALGLLGERAGQVVLEVRGDSRLLQEQLEGRWRTRHPQLLALRDEAGALLRRFRSWRFLRVPREEVVRHLGH
jgi:ribonuclease HI